MNEEAMIRMARECVAESPKTYSIYKALLDRIDHLEQNSVRVIRVRDIGDHEEALMAKWTSLAPEQPWSHTESLGQYVTPDGNHINAHALVAVRDKPQPKTTAEIIEDALMPLIADPSTRFDLAKKITERLEQAGKG